MWVYFIETIYFWTHLPSVAKRKLENGIRTAWTVAIFILLSAFYQWSGSLTFFSGIMSIVSHHLYFGHFIETYYQVMVATVVGSSFGTMVGYVSFDSHLQLAILFVSLLIINRVTVWERISRVVATLTCFLAAFTSQAIISDDESRTKGELTMQVVVLLMFVPYSITAFCILIPYPGLALISGCRKSRRVLLNLRKVVSNVIHSFHDIDCIDVLITEADILISETRPVIEYIANTSRYGANESLLIPSGDLPAFLKTFSTFASSIQDELSGLIVMLRQMPLNLTHLMFADRLRQWLTDFANEVDQILVLIEQRLDQLDFYPSFYERLCSCCSSSEYQASIRQEQQRMVTEYRNAVDKLNSIRKGILNEYREIRINYVFYKAVRTAQSNQSVQITYSSSSSTTTARTDKIKSIQADTANPTTTFLVTPSNQSEVDVTMAMNSSIMKTTDDPGRRHIESVLSTNSLPEVEMHRTSRKPETGLFRRHFSVKDRVSAEERFSHPPNTTRAADIARSLETHRVDIVQNYFEGSHQSVDDVRSLIERETDILSVKNISFCFF